MEKSSMGTKVILALLTLGLLAYFGLQGLRYLDDPLTTTLAYTYQVEKSVDLSGVVIRNETVLPSDSSGLLRLRRTEGERVSKGGLVAAVYADQKSLDRENEIAALDTRIEQLRYAQESALGSEASLKLDNQIKQNILGFRGDLAGDRLDRAELHGREIRSLVLKRDYTYTDSGDLGGQIAELSAQRAQLQSQAASSTRRITAPATGLYSAVVDGYETTLTPETIKSLKPSTLKNLKPDPAVQSQVGKIIVGDTWYYAAVLDAKEAAELDKKGGLSLRFAKSVERDLPVSLSFTSAKEKGKVVVVFQGRSYLPQLTLLRQQSAEVIEKTVQGIRVPKEALRAQRVSIDEKGKRITKDQVGIYCVVGAEARFKPVKVIYSGDDFALVRSALEDHGAVSAVQEKSRIRPGDQVILSAADLYDGKVVIF